MDELIAKIRELRAYLTPNGDVKERVRMLVMAGVRPAEARQWAFFPLFFRFAAGTLALGLVAGVGLFASLSLSTQTEAYVGDAQLLDIGTMEIISMEEGRPTEVQVIEQEGPASPDAPKRKVRVKAGDIIKTSSGSTVALRFDNSSSAVVKDTAVLTVDGVTTKDREDRPKSVTVRLEQGTIETAGENEASVAGSVLQVKTPTTVVETSNAAVTVKVTDGATEVSPLDKTGNVKTLDLGTKIIVAAVEGAVGNANGNSNVNSESVNVQIKTSPTPSAPISPSSSPSPSASADPRTSPTPSPGESPGTGSGTEMNQTRSEGRELRT